MQQKYIIAEESKLIDIFRYEVKPGFLIVYILSGMKLGPGTAHKPTSLILLIQSLLFQLLSVSGCNLNDFYLP